MYNLRQLARIEAGESFVTAETLYKICNELETAPSVLFDINNKEIKVLVKKDKNYTVLRDKLLSILSNPEKIEFINLAFDALEKKDAIPKLEYLLKGMKLSAKR